MPNELKELIARVYRALDDRTIINVIQDIVERAQMDPIFVAKIMEYENE